MRRPARRSIAIANVTVHTMGPRGTLHGQTVVIEAARSCWIANESPPLHPSNRLSAAAFAFALQALAGSKPGSVIDLPVAGSVEEAIAPIELRATRQGLALVVRRHGERSRLVAGRRGDGSVRIREDRFHGRFVTIVR